MIRLTNSFYSFNFNDITYVSYNDDTDKATLFIRYDDKYLEITKHNTDDKYLLRRIWYHLNEYIFNKEAIETTDYLLIKEVKDEERCFPG